MNVDTKDTKQDEDQPMKIANKQDIDMVSDSDDVEMNEKYKEQDSQEYFRENKKNTYQRPIISPEKIKYDKRIEITNNGGANDNWILLGKKKDVRSTNVGMFTTKKLNNTASDKNIKMFPTIADQNETTIKVPVREVTKNVIMCRFKCKIEGTSCNLGLVVKQVVKLFRSADTALQIMPIKSKDCNKIIDMRIHCLQQKRS